MLRTIVWFATGGLFTACYSNAIRGLPLFRKPSMHLLFTSIGLGLGISWHRFEENHEELFKKIVAKHKNAPWYPKGVLLAERAARLEALKASGDFDAEAEIEAEDNFEDDDDEEDEE